ncbi:MAG: flotillin domain-containing protein, partial [Amphiplicatus sp.]
GAGGGGHAEGGHGVADQAVNAALRYRTQAPLLDALMKELGLEGGDMSAIAKSLGNGAKPPAE